MTVNRIQQYLPQRPQETVGQAIDSAKQHLAAAGVQTLLIVVNDPSNSQMITLYTGDRMWLMKAAEIWNMNQMRDYMGGSPVA